jgi:peptidoglycan L-alanyl-D-glutamate endopeptidase CwlK
MPIDWSDIKRMYFYGGIVRAVAEYEKIPIRWGGDWDGDTEVLDQTFNDLGHIELRDVDGG